MTAPTGLTTELEAVNMMLRAIGEAPISSLTSTQTDVGIARSILAEETRSLCAEGWYWNTDDEVTLSPDGDSKYPLPTDAIFVDPVYSTDNVAVRGRFLWDRTNNTDVFTTSSIKVKIVRALAFEALQQNARDYVAMVAAWKFVKTAMGEEGMVQFSQQDVERARLRLEKDEDDHADHNFGNSTSMRHMVGRYRDAHHVWSF